MALEIIGAGFSRTGTHSTSKALNILGFPCYHMYEVTLNPANLRHLDFWCEVADAPPGTQHDWERVFARYRAAVDEPAACVWRELWAAYPDAKILLTVHPKGADAWFDSVVETIYFTEVRWQFKVLTVFVPRARKLWKMTHQLVWEGIHRDTVPDRSKSVAHYEQHIEEVRASVPPEKLLVYSVEQGWEPLCNFLGVSVPAIPFPNVNDRPRFKRMIALLDLGAYAILAGIGVAVGAALYGVVGLIGV